MRCPEQMVTGKTAPRACAEEVLLLGRDVAGPSVHELPPTVEEVAALVGALDSLDHVG